MANIYYDIVPSVPKLVCNISILNTIVFLWSHPDLLPVVIVFPFVVGLSDWWIMWLSWQQGVGSSWPKLCGLLMEK